MTVPAETRTASPAFHLEGAAFVFRLRALGLEQAIQKTGCRLSELEFVHV
jgi:hypothetical protein